MNLIRTLLACTIAVVAATTATAGTISHDQVRPMAQPNPTTVEQKAGVKFKPQLHITNGCHSYPAVNANGDVGGGLKRSGSSDGKCKGSGFGSQVYGRADWHNGVYGIMYSWYFPKDEPSPGIGHRHDWENVVVWIDNPAVANPKIFAVSASAHSGYSHYVPPAADNLKGNAALIDYFSAWPIDHRFRITTETGDSQPLIMWDQLTPAARAALQNTNFGDANVPMKDGKFEQKLREAFFK